MNRQGVQTNRCRIQTYPLSQHGADSERDHFCSQLRFASFLEVAAMRCYLLKYRPTGNDSSILQRSSLRADEQGLTALFNFTRHHTLLNETCTV